MRRSRRASRDSSQDSPVTDNERDILWGDSPPARKIFLAATPGKRLTRSVAAEQDLTDLIDCVHPKETKESSTPPLLGLWMRNREESGSGKKKHRLVRRTTGKKLSRIGLENDLKVLTEWTGNLAAAIESSRSKASGDEAGDAGCSDEEHKTRKSSEEEMECDGLEDVWGEEEDGASGAGDAKQGVGEQSIQKDSRRISIANHSITDDLWGNDDWYDDDSVIMLATQVENEALSQAAKQPNKAEPQTSPFLDVISPTQVESDNSSKAKSIQRTLLPSCSSSGASFNIQLTASSSSQMNVAWNSTVGNSGTGLASKPVSVVSSTSATTAQSTMPSSISTSQRKFAGSSSVRSSGKGLVSKPVLNTSSTYTSKAYTSNSTSTSGTRTSSLCNANKYSFRGNTSSGTLSSQRTWQKPPRVTNTAITTTTLPTKKISPPGVTIKKQGIVKVPPVSTSEMSTTAVAKKISPPAFASKKEEAVRVPPVVTTSANLKTSTPQLKTFDQSLDDLFGDSSLPDDMLLALLDADSDFDEYSTAPETTVSIASSCSRMKTPPPRAVKNYSTGTGKTSSIATNSKMNVSQQPQSSSYQTNKGNQYSKDPQMSSRSTSKNISNVMPKNHPKTFSKPTPRTTPSRVTRSSVQSAIRVGASIAGRSTAAPVSSSSYVVGRANPAKREDVGNRSLSQPVTPAKKTSDAHRFCSQQEIEQKRQAALAKRKRSNLKVSPS